MTNNKKQTAVDWIEQEMLKGNLSLKEILEQAKEKQKQQSINDFVAGNKLEFYDGTEKECAEQYYNETYGGNNQLCCTPEGQIKRYVNCIGCDRKPLIQGGNK
jgi:hypothetical protein